MLQHAQNSNSGRGTLRNTMFAFVAEFGNGNHAGSDL
jgi:hypothetical protein